MKKIKLIMAAALMMIGTSASAQFVQSSEPSYSSNRYNAGWNEFTFDISYGKTYDTGDSYATADEDLYGLSFNYARGIHLSRKNGLTLRPGVGVYVGYQNVEARYDDMDVTFASLTPKLDFGYHITWPSSSISLFPYVGVITRINYWGQVDYDGETYDLFDEDGADASRFQVGARVGFDAHLNKFILGVACEYDFNEINDDVKIWTANVKIGWTFGH